MISIIMPVYNAEKYVGRAIESVLAQTYENYELIIVNDGSTDMSAEICKRYKDKRIYSTTQPNRGVSAARNVGMLVARGELFLFLDADDYLKSCALQRLYAAHVDTGCSIAIGGVLRVAPEDKAYMDTSCFPSEVYDENKIGHRILNYLESLDDPVVSHCWGRLYSRSLIEANSIKFAEGIKVGEDGAFNIRCLTYAKYVAILKEPLYCFQTTKDSSSRKAIKERQMNLLPFQNALVYYFRIRVDSGMEELYNKTMAWGNRE